jgi:hypothetical protein
VNKGTLQKKGEVIGRQGWLDIEIQLHPKSAITDGLSQYPLKLS